LGRPNFSRQGAGAWQGRSQDGLRPTPEEKKKAQEKRPEKSGERPDAERKPETKGQSIPTLREHIGRRGKPKKRKKNGQTRGGLHNKTEKETEPTKG